jgi:hypothetical protein
MESTNTSKPISAAEDTNLSEATLACVHRASILTSSTGPSPAFLGISVRRLVRLLDELPGGSEVASGLTTFQWMNQVLKYHANSAKQSVCQRLLSEGDDGVGIASWFICFYLKDPILHCIETLVHFFEGEPLGLDTLIWFEAVSTYRIDLLTFVDQCRLISDAIQHAGNMLVTCASGSWDKPTLLTRKWCIYEIYVCCCSSSRVEFAHYQSQREQLLCDMRSRPAAFIEMLANVRSETSVWWNLGADDIFIVVPASIGYAGLDTAVRRALQSWMVRLLLAKVSDARCAGLEEETADFLRALSILQCHESKEEE